jgi:hypothetical protein
MTLTSSAAQAGEVVVTDSGSIGSFDMTNMGISGGTATILITRQPNPQSQINAVNGVSVAPDPPTVNGPVTLLVKETGELIYSLVLVPSTYTTTVGATPGSQAEMAFNVSKGATTALVPDVFNMPGTITALLANADPTYDFSKFANGLGSINITLTATTFTGGGHSSFSGLLSTVGATATGNGSFSSLASLGSAVDEPTSIALLGIGVGGFLDFRRIVRKRFTVA